MIDWHSVQFLIRSFVVAWGDSCIKMTRFRLEIYKRHTNVPESCLMGIAQMFFFLPLSGTNAESSCVFFWLHILKCTTILKVVIFDFRILICTNLQVLMPKRHKHPGHFHMWSPQGVVAVVIYIFLWGGWGGIQC